MALLFGSGGGFPTWVNANVTLDGHWNSSPTGFYTPKYAGATALAVAFTIQPLGTEFNVTLNGKGWMSQQYGGGAANGFWIKHLGNGVIQCAIWGVNMDLPPRTITTGPGVLIPDVPNYIMMRWQGGTPELFTVMVNGTIYSPTPAGYGGGPVPSMSPGPDAWNNPVELGGASAIDEGPVSGVYQQWALWTDYLPDSDALNYGLNGNPGLLSKPGIYWVTLAQGTITDRNGVPGADPAGFYKAGFGPIGHLIDAWSGFHYGDALATYNYGDGPYQQPFTGVFEHFTEVADLPTGGTQPPALPNPVTHLLTGSQPIAATLPGSVILVGTGPNDLSDAINGIGAYVGRGALTGPSGDHRGNTYVCPAGTVYNNILFPLGGGTVSPTNYTRIKTDATLPPFGTRIGGVGQTFDVNDLPKLVTVYNSAGADNSPGITVPVGSAGWHFLGFHCTQSVPAYAGYGMISVEGKRVCFEHSYVHPHPTSTHVARGIHVRSENTSDYVEDVQFWDCFIDDIRSDTFQGGFDAQAIWFARSRRMHVENCRLSATGESVMLSSQYYDLSCLDTTMKRNYFYRPLSWFQFLMDQVTPNPAWDGNSYVIKAVFETKASQRTLLEGNIFENCGSCITVNTQNLENNDFTAQHNTFKQSVAWAQIASEADEAHVPPLYTRQMNHRLKFYNNLVLTCRTEACRWQYKGGDMWFDHNTVLTLDLDTPQVPRVLFLLQGGGPVDMPRHMMRNNIWGGIGGIQMEFTPGAGTLDDALPGRVWEGNALCQWIVWPLPGGFIGFHDYQSAGVDPLTGKLLPGSPLIGAATEFGRPALYPAGHSRAGQQMDIGVDFETLLAAQGGVLPPPPPPPPNLIGYLDNVKATGAVNGWVGDQNNPSVRQIVTITIGGIPVGTVTANQSRPDVHTAFPILDGNQGYTFQIPSSFFDGASHSVGATVGGIVLNSSPKTVTLSAQSFILKTPKAITLSVV